MKSAFICVNYNNSKYTLDYILSLENVRSQNVEIIVVDNNSNKSELAQLGESNLNFQLIKSKINLGYFKGLNLAIDSIEHKEEYDYIIVGNNDLSFSANFVFELSNEEIDSSIFVIAPNIIKLNGQHQNPHITDKFSLIARIYRKLYFSNYVLAKALQFFTNIRSRLFNFLDRKSNNVEQIILMGYGACYILTKNFFNNFDNLDSPNFLMGEEGVLANQVLSKNGKTIYKPNLIVHHHDHTSIGKISSRSLYNFSKESYIYACKNHKWLEK